MLSSVTDHGSFVRVASVSVARASVVSRPFCPGSWVGECVVEIVCSIVMTYGRSSVQRCLSFCSS